MNKIDKVVVCSRSFSQNNILRTELLKRYKYVKFNDDGLKLAGESLITFMRGHTKAITALELLNKNVLESLSEMKVISKYGVGLDMIDIPVMSKLGIRLGWQEGVNRRSVAELTLAFALSLIRRVPEAIDLVRNNSWRQVIGMQLTGKIFGIIGFGNIGKDLVKLLQPFSCKIFVNDILDQPHFYLENNITLVTLEELLTTSDVVSLHVPLMYSTRNILDKQKLSLLKPSAILINTARGGLVDEVALKELLKDKKIEAAAFDVFAQEPPADIELLSLPNFYATPHMGGSSEEAILAMGMAAIEGLDNNRIPDNFL
jgi:phosphoglycerate dehydrogenase-like enzyme